MVDAVSAKAKEPSITLARLKVSPPSARVPEAGLSDAESRLADLVDIGTEAKSKLRQGRKSGYLSLYQSVLKLLDGFNPLAYKPRAASVEVELYQRKILDKQV
jgi:hypothetical protein